MGEEHDGSRDDREFEDRVRNYTLSQLEDVFAHIDREAHFERFDRVQTEIRSRLEDLATENEGGEDPDEVPRAARRLWASVVDLFVSLLPAAVVGLVLVAAGVVSLGGGDPPGRGRGGPGGRGGGGDEPTFFDQVVSFLSDPEKMTEALETYGPYYGALVVYRIVLVVPQWSRSGSSAGLREAGVRLVDSKGGAPGAVRGAVRIVGAYIIYPMTLGLGAAWLLIDRSGRSIADRVSGVFVLRARGS